MNTLEKYYNKFNEDKRLLSRHGQVEFTVANKYIEEVINGRKNLDIIDIGAGTGRYSILLSEQGHNVTAVEPVNKNLSTIKLKSNKVIAKKGNALNLKKFESEKYDITLLFGPLYHLFSFQDKLKAINEAKRITKKGGHILIMYLMNEYAVITYAFKEGNLNKCLQEGKLDPSFKCLTSEEDLYSYSRLEDINLLLKESNLKRYKIISVDGATDYIRPILNSLSEEEFKTFIDYQLCICERPELLGASSHVLDILINE